MADAEVVHHPNVERVDEEDVRRARLEVVLLPQGSTGGGNEGIDEGRADACEASPGEGAWVRFGRIGRTRLFSSFCFPVSPRAPYRVMDTLASVPAPRRVPVRTVTL